MTLYEFSILERADQESIINSSGSFIGTREENGFMMDLYQLEGYYVEFFYHTNDGGKIVTRCFTSPDEIQPYLENNTKGPL